MARPGLREVLTVVSSLQVERGKQAHYCFNEADLKNVLKTFPSNASYNIQRFKGRFALPG